LYILIFTFLGSRQEDKKVLVCMVASITRNQSLLISPWINFDLL
jgi:hypothetical protein